MLLFWCCVCGDGGGLLFVKWWVVVCEVVDMLWITACWHGHKHRHDLVYAGVPQNLAKKGAAARATQRHGTLPHVQCIIPAPATTALAAPAARVLVRLSCAVTGGQPTSVATATYRARRRLWGLVNEESHTL